MFLTTRYKKLQPLLVPTFQYLKQCIGSVQNVKSYGGKNNSSPTVFFIIKIIHFYVYYINIVIYIVCILILSTNDFSYTW